MFFKFYRVAYIKIFKFYRIKKNSYSMFFKFYRVAYIKIL